MIIAGLTGGIASGKSTVSRFLADAGARIIDADILAREVVKSGTPAYDEIVSFFGREILQTDGEIDRSGLGKIIFNHPEKKAQLNAIVHPKVFKRSSDMIKQIHAETPDAVVIMDIPLLLETGRERDMAEVIVVYVPEAMQLQRLMKRDGISKEDAMSRIRAQMPIEEKRKRATIVIDNRGTQADTRKYAMAVFNTLKAASGQSP